MYRLFVFLVLLVSVFSCSEQEKNPLVRAWIFDERNSIQEKARKATDYAKIAYLDGACFLDLQENGKFTSYFTHFNHGSWKFEDGRIKLTDHQNRRSEFNLISLEKDGLICFNPKTGFVYPFRGYANQFRSDSSNPFSIENNQWRITPLRKETDEEIAKRLKNHCRYWEKYFAWGRDADLKFLVVESTPSLFRVAGNGFELKYYEYQFPEWKRCFFDSADCYKAYEIMYYQMYYRNINWLETENRFERLASAFQQMQSWMDSIPEIYRQRRDSSRLTINQ